MKYVVYYERITLLVKFWYANNCCILMFKVKQIVVYGALWNAVGEPMQQRMQVMRRQSRVHEPEHWGAPSTVIRRRAFHWWLLELRWGRCPWSDDSHPSDPTELLLAATNKLLEQSVLTVVGRQELLLVSWPNQISLGHKKIQCTIWLFSFVIALFSPNNV